MDRSVDKRSLDVLSCEKQAWTSGLDDINMEEDYCKVCWVEGVGGGMIRRACWDQQGAEKL